MTAMSPQLRDVEQPGLRWEEELMFCKPHWTQEPSLDIIKKLVVQHHHLTEDPEVAFFKQGAFNKLYAIDCTKGRFIFRVSLPVAPSTKTKSEVATLSFTREKASIPVPRVFAHDANLHNELGFEWILMERVEAQPLQEVWHSMSWLKKGLLVMQTVDFMAQLFRLQESAIGSLYLADQRGTPRDTTSNYVVGEIVLMPFFQADNIKLDIPRGPFATPLEYIQARIQLTQHYARKLNLEDEDDLEHFQDIQVVLSGIQTVLPRLFPTSTTPEPTILCNADISPNNVLVSPDGSLVSIVDWECVAALPLFQAVQLPEFLTSEDRQDPPDFQTIEDHNEVYLEQIEFHEKTRLREFFLEEMRRVEPKWVEVYERQQKQRDVIVALDYCESDWLVKKAKGWIGAMLEGREPKMSLGD